MPKVERWPVDTGEVRWAFDCPGCGLPHAPTVDGGKPGSPKWTFNHDSEHPTFSPSLMVRWTQDGVDMVCHSFVRGGRIEFLGDCTHDLAGHTVDLPDLEDD
jgi:hypothetical protein